MAIHILPVNDLIEHEESSICECCPELRMENNEMMFIHNSYDGREESGSEFDWVALKKDFPKAIKKMSTWIKQNRFKKLIPTHLLLQPCERHEDTGEVSNLMSIPIDPKFLDKFFSDVLGKEVKNAKFGIGELFEEYEDLLSLL